MEDESERKLTIIRNRFNEMTDEEIFGFIGSLEQRAKMNIKHEPGALENFGFHHFFPNIDGIPESVDINLITEKKRHCFQMFWSLVQRMKELGLEEKSSIDMCGNEMPNNIRIARLIEEYNDSYEMIYHYARHRQRLENPYEVASMDSHLTRLSTILNSDEISRTPYQDLLLYLFDRLSFMKFKRYKGNCCRQILVGPSNFKTRAWEPVMSIQEFVYSVTQKEDKFDMWCKLTSKGTAVKDAVKHLTDCIDPQFPELRKNRHVWSFNNGIFSIADGHVKFYEYGSEEYHSLDPLIVSSKYFDADFDLYQDRTDWYDIPTPYMQKVMDYQGFDEKVCRWMYIFVGRLLFDINERDSWQVIPFLKGIAGSGKSTLICKVVKKFYDADDVRVLSNNSEKKFGLWSIYDGFIFISPEIKGDICLEQAEFQSIVSGEEISIARKNEKAITIQWTTPGIFGGNEMPGWKDNSGSIIRRLVAFQFLKKVHDADPTLDSKLESELPSILCKCARAYIEASGKYRDVDIWNVLPDYFKSIQKQISMVTNPLHHFLGSEKCRFGKDLFVPQNIFVKLFNNHCSENNLGRYKFHPDFYAGPFGAKDLEVKVDTVTWNGKLYQNQHVVYGVDISGDIVEEY